MEQQQNLEEMKRLQEQREIVLKNKSKVDVRQ